MLLKGVKWVVRDSSGKDQFWPSEELKKKAWVTDESIYQRASEDPVSFWAERAREGIDWYKDWQTTYESKPPYIKWFVGGKLNACYNAVDRHADSWRRNKVAVIWEPERVNEPNRIFTYYDLYREVCKFANVLKSLGVKKGDRVGIYLPMIPEVIIAMLACVRIGAVHSVCFSAFSGKSLRDRMLDAEAVALVTADGYWRRGKPFNLKVSADEGVEGTSVRNVIVVKRIGMDVKMVEGRDHWWHDLMKDASPVNEPEVLDSEDMMFILYTSGTTGKPKGIVHHTGGYVTQAYWTAKWDFDLHDEDVFWCTADIGWITGHTYNCYGPLLVGSTFLIYEGAPDFPAEDRMWAIAEKYGVTVFYTAPTAIRMFMKWRDEPVEKHDLGTLRILGTVGEPINHEAWMWYFEKIGGGRCPIIDTWWQTETGGTLINALPGIGPFIPTVAGRPFPGVKVDVLDEKGDSLPPGEGGYLVLKAPYAPGLLRDVFRDPARYRAQYWSQYGDEIYFTSDGARRDEFGNIRLLGRVDDVMKVAGHRLATAELENALSSHPYVAESAVVPMPHEIKGEVPVAFVILKAGEPSDKLREELVRQVVDRIGPTAKPEKIVFVSDVPKTRSGKIMRRILRSLAANEKIGDISTLRNPECIEELKQKIGYIGPS